MMKVKGISYLRSLTEQELEIICLNFHGATGYLNSLNISNNARNIKIVNNKLKEFNLKWWNIRKKCPVCQKYFFVPKNTKKVKTTCSYSCANTYFRSGINAANITENSYRVICFHYHKKECIICGESNIVEVHHYDGDHYNNNPKNLIPLCPTHHKYMHSNYRKLIEEKIDEYYKQFSL